MNLHDDKDLFAEIVLRASQPVEVGGLGINAGFIEKDYWITRSLQQLSSSQSVDYAVFKGGTSLSKIFKIGARFSEDIDIAIVSETGMHDAQLKSIIRTTQKAMSAGLEEIDKPGMTSKGSRYRKVYFEYPQLSGVSLVDSLMSGQLLIEINSFANPIPYSKQPVTNFIQEYLIKSGNESIVDEFDLGTFEINVLDKRTTLTEKLVSLIRFSLSDNPMTDMQAKIRHFYDLHYLASDKECKHFLNSSDFTDAFNQLLEHDREMFEHPSGWQKKSISESPLVQDLDYIWLQLAPKYLKELPSLAYTKIPTADEVAESIKFIIERL